MAESRPWYKLQCPIVSSGDPEVADVFEVLVPRATADRGPIRLRTFTGRIRNLKLGQLQGQLCHQKGYSGLIWPNEGVSNSIWPFLRIFDLASDFAGRDLEPARFPYSKAN